VKLFLGVYAPGNPQQQSATCAATHNTSTLSEEPRLSAQNVCTPSCKNTLATLSHCQPLHGDYRGYAAAQISHFLVIDRETTFAANNQRGRNQKRWSNRETHHKHFLDTKKPVQLPGGLGDFVLLERQVCLQEAEQGVLHGFRGERVI